jgi:hypothetical protein
MISFGVSLTKSDWNAVLGAWQCSALKIPGAQVDNLFADGLKLDNAWYVVDYDNQLVRWVRGTEPPKIGALVVSLTKDLVATEQVDFWKKLAVLVPILAALVSALGAYATANINGQTKSAESAGQPTALEKLQYTPDHAYERWTVAGRVRVQDSNPYNVMAFINPPMIPLRESGSFDTEIPVVAKSAEHREFPTLTFVPRQAGYIPISIELAGSPVVPGQKASSPLPAGSYEPPDFGVQVNYKERRIVIGKEVLIARASAGYSPKSAQQARPVK